MLPAIDQLMTLPPGEVTELLLAEPESQLFDRKSSRIHSATLAETMVAMANAEGGMVVIGLANGVCEGVQQRQREQNAWRQAGIDHTNPPVRFEVYLPECINRNGDLDRLFVLLIAPGDRVHATSRDEVFLRVGDENRRLRFEQRIQLGYDRGDTGFERTSAANYGPAELDAAAVADYARRMEHSAPPRLLQARDLVSADGVPFVAAELLFGVNPQRAFPQAYVRVLKYAGRERRTGNEQNLSLTRRCEGPLPRQLEEAMQCIREAMPTRRRLGDDGRFGWFGIIPEEAWLEALVNAVVHRAYSNFGDHIRVELFDDRVELSSPGRFPGVTAPDDLMNVPRFSRNPRIARALSELAYGQEYGEGLRRMVRAMEAAGLPRPVVTQSAGGVTVALLAVVPAARELKSLPETAQALFRLISQEGRASTGELVTASRHSRPVVLRNLRLLEARGLIQRVGGAASDPRAFWTTT